MHETHDAELAAVAEFFDSLPGELTEATAVPPVVAHFAQKAGVKPAEAHRRYKEAEKIAAEQFPKIEKGSDQAHAVQVGVFKGLMRFKPLPAQPKPAKPAQAAPGAVPAAGPSGRDVSAKGGQDASKGDQGRVRVSVSVDGHQAGGPAAKPAKEPKAKAAESFAALPENKTMQPMVFEVLKALSAVDGYSTGAQLAERAGLDRVSPVMAVLPRLVVEGLVRYEKGRGYALAPGLTLDEAVARAGSVATRVVLPSGDKLSTAVAEADQDADAYVASIKNAAKKKYAQALLASLRSSKAPKPERPADLSYMAAQAVRLELEQRLHMDVVTAESVDEGELVPCSAEWGSKAEAQSNVADLKRKNIRYELYSETRGKDGEVWKIRTTRAGLALIGESVDEAEAVPGVNKWSMHAGGTGAAADKHGYTHNTEHGTYHVDPVSHPNGRHKGYSLKFTNNGPKQSSKLPHQGLWHDLGLHGSPAAAAKKAREHHTSIHESVEEGRSTTPPYVYELFSASGGRIASDPMAWRVADYGKPNEANLKKMVDQFNASLEDGGANAHLGTARKAAGALVRRNQGSGSEVLARFGTAPTKESVEEGRDAKTFRSMEAGGKEWKLSYDEDDECVDIVYDDEDEEQHYTATVKNGRFQLRDENGLKGIPFGLVPRVVQNAAHDMLADNEQEMENESVEEGSDDYGVRWSEWGRDNRLVNKSKFFATEKALEAFLKKLADNPDLHEIQARKYPEKDESLLPSTLAGYERVIAEGGLSGAALEIVLGTLDTDGLTIEDDNGVVWGPGEDGRWFPLVDSLAEAKKAKGYWRTTKGGRRIYIENGRITKGNPHVIRAIHGRKHESLDENFPVKDALKFLRGKSEFKSVKWEKGASDLSHAFVFDDEDTALAAYKALKAEFGAKLNARRNGEAIDFYESVSDAAKKRTLKVKCLDCGAKFETSAAGKVSACPKCESENIDLERARGYLKGFVNAKDRMRAARENAKDRMRAARENVEDGIGSHQREIPLAIGVRVRQTSQLVGNIGGNATGVIVGRDGENWIVRDGLGGEDTWASYDLVPETQPPDEEAEQSTMFGESIDEANLGARSDIIKGMARAMFVSWWADEEERKREDDPSYKLPYGAGDDVMDFAPKTSANALRKATALAKQFDQLNRSSVEKLYAKAKAEGFKGDEERFGHYLGMSAIGHGVRWDDDVSTDFEIKHPNTEYYESTSAIGAGDKGEPVYFVWGANPDDGETDELIGAFYDKARAVDLKREYDSDIKRQYPLVKARVTVMKGQSVRRTGLMRLARSTDGIRQDLGKHPADESWADIFRRKKKPAPKPPAPPTPGRNAALATQLRRKRMADSVEGGEADAEPFRELTDATTSPLVGGFRTSGSIRQAGLKKGHLRFSPPIDGEDEEEADEAVAESENEAVQKFAYDEQGGDSVKACRNCYWGESAGGPTVECQLFSFRASAKGVCDAWTRNGSSVGGKSAYKRAVLQKMESVDEVSPPGWKGSVEAMKRDQSKGKMSRKLNPWALAWSMKKKGHTPHYSSRAPFGKKHESLDEAGLTTWHCWPKGTTWREQAPDTKNPTCFFVTGKTKKEAIERAKAKNPEFDLDTWNFVNYASTVESLDEGYQHVHWKGAHSLRFDITKPNGKKKSVQGRSFGKYIGIHMDNAVRGGDWTITHIPTGLRLGSTGMWDEQAVRFAKSLEGQLGDKLNFTDPATVSDEVKAAIVAAKQKLNAGGYGYQIPPSSYKPMTGPMPEGEGTWGLRWNVYRNWSPRPTELSREFASKAERDRFIKSLHNREDYDWSLVDVTDPKKDESLDELAQGQGMFTDRKEAEAKAIVWARNTKKVMFVCRSDANFVVTGWTGGYNTNSGSVLFVAKPDGTTLSGSKAEDFADDFFDRKPHPKLPDTSIGDSVEEADDADALATEYKKLAAMVGLGNKTAKRRYAEVRAKLKELDPERLARLDKGLSEDEPVAEADMTVANAILKQLGGNKFVAMTGAKNLAGDVSSLSFSVGKNPSGVNRVRVTLKGDDTYAMECFRIRGTEAKVVKQASDLHAADLRRAFTDATGLETSLGSMGESNDKQSAAVMLAIPQAQLQEFAAVARKLGLPAETALDRDGDVWRVELPESEAAQVRELLVGV